MKILRKLIALALITILLMSQQSVLAAETILIGGNFEMTGAAASYGTPMYNAMKLAVDQVNEKGGILGGRKLEIKNYDNKSDLTETSSVATRLIDDGVIGIVGPATTGDSQAQIPVITSKKVPAVLPAATGDGITTGDDGKTLDYLFRVCFEDSYQGKVAGKYIAEEMKAKKVMLIIDSGLDYSQGVAEAFKKEFESRGGKVVGKETYTSADTDFQALLTTVASKDFDVIYAPGYYTEMGLMIKQARELGITQPIIGGDGFSSPTLVDLAGPENANDIYYTCHFSDASEDKKVQDFIKAYEEKYKQEPDNFAALSYDATCLLIDAIERANAKSPEAVKKALEETKDFEGVTGKFTIDEKHNPIKSVLMVKLKNGKIESTELISAE